jgi:hypothetical protein
MSARASSIVILLGSIALACDTSATTKESAKSEPTTDAAKPTAMKAEAKAEAAPEKVEPPQPDGTVCAGQEQLAATTMKALTACVTKAVDASGVADASTTMAKLAADTLACTDKGCNEKMTAAVTSYGQELADKRKEKSATAECETAAKAAIDASSKLHECTTAAMGGNDVDAAIAMMGTFSDEMCACKDKTCAEAVTGRMVEYGEAMMRKHEGQPEPAVSDAQKQRMEESMKKLTACTTTAMVGQQP